MNTPLGPQGAAHQARRDKHERIFQERYGNTASAPIEKKIEANRKAKQAKDFFAKRIEAVKQAGRILAASGRSNSFA